MSKTTPALPSRRRARSAATQTTGSTESRSTRDVFGELAAAGRLHTIALADIDPNPAQPRRSFDQDRLQELTESIRAHGILQPPVVRQAPGGRWQLVAGERRVRAARLAGLESIEALQDSRSDGATDALLALLENTARHDLSPIEQARAFASLIEDLGISREEVARQVGQSRSSVSNHLRLLDLPDQAIALVDEGILSFAHGRALLLVEGQKERTQLANRAVTEGWSTRQLEDQARREKAPTAPRRANQIDPELTTTAQRLQDRLIEGGAAGWSIKPRKTGAVTFEITVGDIEAAEDLTSALLAARSARNER